MNAGRPRGRGDSLPARVRKVEGAQLPSTTDADDIREFSKEILRTYERAWVEQIFAGDDRRLQFEILRLAKSYAHGSPVSVSEVRVSRPEDRPEELLKALAQKKARELQEAAKAAAVTVEIVPPAPELPAPGER